MAEYLQEAGRGKLASFKVFEVEVKRSAPISRLQIRAAVPLAERDFHHHWQTIFC